MNGQLISLLLGILIGVLLSAVALVWDACKSKKPRVWIDDDYKIHLIKRK